MTGKSSNARQEAFPATWRIVSAGILPEDRLDADDQPASTLGGGLCLNLLDQLGDHRPILLRRVVLKGRQALRPDLVARREVVLLELDPLATGVVLLCPVKPVPD
jgi:hypothetical protein